MAIEHHIMIVFVLLFISMGKSKCRIMYNYQVFMQDEPIEIQHGLPMDEPAIAKIHASILTGSTLCANLTKLDEGKFYQTPTYIYIYRVKPVAFCICFFLQ